VRIGAAHEILSDDEKRREYDRYGIIPGTPQAQQRQQQQRQQQQYWNPHYDWQVRAAALACARLLPLSSHAPRSISLTSPRLA
jgi:curved DNA-binding protein CbpA